MRKFLIENKAPRIFTVHHEKGAVRMMPNVNVITEEEWDAIKGNPLLKKRFEMDLVAFVAGKGPDDNYKMPEVSKGRSAPAAPPVDDNSSPLEGMNAEQSMAVVRKITDLILLERLEQQEERKGVLKVIREQIDKFTPTGKPEKDEDEDDEDE